MIEGKNIFDIGFNCSVLSTLDHNDLDLKLELSNTLEMIDTAGGQSINIPGSSICYS